MILASRSARGPVVVIALLAVAALYGGCASSSGAGDQRRGPLQHYQTGRMYFEQGRVADALKEINESLRQDRSLPQVWFYRGYIYWTLEDWKQAEQDFRTALERNMYYTDARMYLATCLDRQGRHEDALRELDRALEDRTFPTPEQILLNKALILRDLGRLDEALAAVRDAVTVRPRYFRGHYEMARTLVQLRRLDEAAAAFTAAEQGYTRDAQFHFDRGETLFLLRRNDDAARELRRAVELAPGSETARRASELLKEIG